MRTEFRNNETFLAPGLTLRSATWSDAEAVAQLIYDSCAAGGDAIAIGGAV